VSWITLTNTSTKQSKNETAKNKVSRFAKLYKKANMGVNKRYDTEVEDVNIDMVAVSAVVIFLNKYEDIDVSAPEANTREINKTIAQTIREVDSTKANKTQLKISPKRQNIKISFSLLISSSQCPRRFGKKIKGNKAKGSSTPRYWASGIPSSISLNGIYSTAAEKNKAKPTWAKIILRMSRL